MFTFFIAPLLALFTQWQCLSDLIVSVYGCVLCLRAWERVEMLEQELPLLDVDDFQHFHQIAPSELQHNPKSITAYNQFWRHYTSVHKFPKTVIYRVQETVVCVWLLNSQPKG